MIRAFLKSKTRSISYNTNLELWQYFDRRSDLKRYHSAKSTQRVLFALEAPPHDRIVLPVRSGQRGALRRGSECQPGGLAEPRRTEPAGEKRLRKPPLRLMKTLR